MVIVNWNTEWASLRSPRAGIILRQLLEFDPEVVCLTEAYLDFLPDSGYVIAAEADYGYAMIKGRRKVLLWSRRPWANISAQSPAGMPPGRYVYGETETSLGLLGIHGLCIPWAEAHVRTGHKNRQRWQDHLAYLSALPAAMDEQDCDLQILAGDFNQRIPRRRVPVHVYQTMQDVLEDRFTILTEDVISPIDKQTIDHIAVVDKLAASRVQSISNIGPEGQKLSDHFGIMADLYRAN